MKQLDNKKISHYIKQITRGNTSAVDKLFEYTYLNMKCIAENYLIDKNCSEDILVELYKIIMSKSNTFDENKNAYNWMYTITKNLALAENNRTKKVEYLGENYHNIADDSFEPLRNLIVQEIIEILGEKEKKLLYQIFWEGYTIKEISAIEGIPIATIYTQRARIYKKMKEFLKSE